MPKAANRNGYASRVNILKYVKIGNKWRFAPVQLVNNKLKFDWVLIDGQPERHTEGTYYIEWYEDGRRRRRSVKDSAELLEQARRKVVELDAEKAGLEIAGNEDDKRTRLSDAVSAYLKEMEPPQREVTTYSAYKLHLQLFVDKLHQDSCSRCDSGRSSGFHPQGIRTWLRFADGTQSRYDSGPAAQGQWHSRAAS